MLGIRHFRLYKQVYADDTLTEAWRHVRTGTDQAGVDGVTVVQFQARLFANLKALQNTLMQQRYYPQPIKRIAIPKADGTRRPLGILTVTDSGRRAPGIFAQTGRARAFAGRYSVAAVCQRLPGSLRQNGPQAGPETGALCR